MILKFNNMGKLLHLESIGQTMKMDNMYRCSCQFPGNFTLLNFSKTA
jgi:hypothetical protein